MQHALKEDIILLQQGIFHAVGKRNQFDHGQRHVISQKFILEFTSCPLNIPQTSNASLTLALSAAQALKVAKMAPATVRKYLVAVALGTTFSDVAWASTATVSNDPNRQHC
jgi:hypothetical protein